MIDKVEVGASHVETPAVSAAEEVKRALLGFSLSVAAAAFAFGVFMFR